MTTIRIITVGVLVSAMLVSSGVAKYRWTGQMATDDKAERQIQRLLAMPTQIGDWQMELEIEPDQKVLDILECKAYLQREYKNSATGESINVAWIAGPSGPTVAHVPEICYSSKNHSLKTRSMENITGEHSVWKTTFSANNVDASKFVVHYGWSSGVTWEASKKPRFDFGGIPLLHKIQVSGGTSSTEQESPGARFLQAFIGGYWITSVIDE